MPGPWRIEDFRGLRKDSDKPCHRQRCQVGKVVEQASEGENIRGTLGVELVKRETQRPEPSEGCILPLYGTNHGLRPRSQSNSFLRCCW